MGRGQGVVIVEADVCADIIYSNNVGKRLEKGALGVSLASLRVRVNGIRRSP